MSLQSSHIVQTGKMFVQYQGLRHKHLLVNIVRALSEIKNAVLTPSSPVEPPEKIKISKSASAQMPTNLAFSVEPVVRTKYEPVKNSK